MFAATIAVTLIAAVGCHRDSVSEVSPRREPPVELDDVRLVRAATCDQLVAAAKERQEALQEEGRRWQERQHVAESPTAESGPASEAEDGQRAYRGGAVATTIPVSPGSNVSDTATSGTAAPDEVGGGTVIAGTNNQEAGVDEGDMVKTDGRRMVVLTADGTLRVVLLDESPAVDGSASVLPDSARSDTTSTSEAAGGQSAQLLLRGNEAVTVMPARSTSGEPTVVISRVDLTVASTPRVVEQTQVAGGLVATRMVERSAQGTPVVRIVIRPLLQGIEPVPVPTVTTTTEPPTTIAPTTTEPTTTTTEPPTTTEPTPTTTDSTTTTTTTDAPVHVAGENPAIPTDAARLLPQRIEADGTTSPIGTCSDVLSVPPSPDTTSQGDASMRGTGSPEMEIEPVPPEPSTSGVTVLTVGAQLGDLAPVTVEGGAEAVYATTDALYTTVTERVLDGGVTAVHRFDLTAPGAARYTGSGLVPGSMLDRYSMSDRGGALRIVTTATTRVDGSMDAGGATDDMTTDMTAGRLTVLRPDAKGTLREVGRLDDIGVGEEVKSVRFLDDRAYVVTFRQTDPLFALDLSDDSAPKVLGELKMPGFSEYLHPLSDGRLLGIGSDADPRTGRTTGFKATLFDVSDPTAPKELDSIVESERLSSVGEDPHAFTWDPVRRQAIVPVSSTTVQAWPGSTSTGRSICPAGAACTSPPPPKPCVPAPEVPCGGVKTVPRWSGADVIAVDGDGLVLRGTIEQAIDDTTPVLLRSVVVDSTIWSVSSRGIGGHDAGSLKSTATVRF